MSEIDLSAFIPEDEAAAVDEEPPRFPVPGGYVDLIPIGANIYCDLNAISVKAGGSWGFCPFGVFITEGDASDFDEPIDTLIPYREIKSIVYDFAGFEKWKAENEDNSD